MGAERRMKRAARQAERLAERSDEILSEGENLLAELTMLSGLELDDEPQAPRSYAPRACMKCDTIFTPTYRHNTVCPDCQRSDAWRLGIAPHHDTRLDGGRR